MEKRSCKKHIEVVKHTFALIMCHLQSGPKGLRMGMLGPNVYQLVAHVERLLIAAESLGLHGYAIKIRHFLKLGLLRSLGSILRYHAINYMYPGANTASFPCKVLT